MDIGARSKRETSGRCSAERENCEKSESRMRGADGVRTGCGRGVERVVKVRVAFLAKVTFMYVKCT
jgi:hypothetical protein